ncbi:hypothetical protein CA221_12400 [Sphingomonas koreensis]|nr:hypothetical protein CA224_06875 [Sphingomonas koreensis]RSU32314.1 hypothetical protein CA225_02610 [Sphingomonas koreensis]RSU35771.1 hypothetical protein BRX39_08780 [Sphingomonas koreensis]RSU49943.1 hypothetical protein CA221_12400 [Sphingomonas koreensis]
MEWTERSDWNPLRGCSRVSEGCGSARGGGCYAEKIAARFSDPGQAFHGFATRTGGGRWTGRVEVQWDRLLLPLSWRRPALLFGSSTSDLFHEKLPLHEIAQVFAVSVAAYHLRGHRTQWLTKRADRMRELLHSEEFWDIVNAHAGMLVMERVDPLNRRSDDARATLDDYDPQTPPPGIWLGVSVEDQRAADERIPHLLATPAAIRFLSCEPLLGPVDLERSWHGESALDSECWGECNWCRNGADFPPLWNCQNGRQSDAEREKMRSGIDWVIWGGESGPGSREFAMEWGAAIVDQCSTAGVPVFGKQLGARPTFEGRRWRTDDRKSGDPAQWPEPLRVREMPGAQHV